MMIFSAKITNPYCELTHKTHAHASRLLGSSRENVNMSNTRTHSMERDEKIRAGTQMPRRTLNGWAPSWGNNIHDYAIYGPAYIYICGGLSISCHIISTHVHCVVFDPPAISIFFSVFFFFGLLHYYSFYKLFTLATISDAHKIEIKSDGATMRRIQMWNDKIYVWVWPTTHKILSRWWFAENKIVCALQRMFDRALHWLFSAQVVEQPTSSKRLNNRSESESCRWNMDEWMRLTHMSADFILDARHVLSPCSLHHKCPESWWKKQWKWCSQKWSVRPENC